MLDSNVSFKFLLIYGRGTDRDKTEERRNKFLQKKTNDIKVCTIGGNVEDGLYIIEYFC